MLLVSGYLYLTSRSGGERILRIALANARNSIQGTLDAQRLEFGGNHLVLHNAVLRDPEGKVVAEIETVEVRLSLFALIRRTLAVRQLIIVAPRVHLRADDRGLNLTRAIQPRQLSPPTAPTEKSGSSDVGFALDELQLRAGTIELTQMSGETKRELRLEGLQAEGAGAYASREDKLKVDLQLDGTVTRPTRGPLSLKLSAQGSGERRRGQLALVLAGLRLDASANMAGEELQAKLERLELPTELISAWVPSYPLLVPVTASGEAARRGDVTAGKFQLKAGSTVVDLVGSLDVARLRSQGITLRARGINLRELVENGPESNLALDAHAEGGGHSLETLDGALEVVAPSARMRGYSVGPIEVEARARQGVIDVPKLVALLPGLRLAGAGRGSTREVSFSGTLTAANLDALSKTLGGLARRRPLQISGTGELQLAVKGPTRHPGLTVNGAFARLRYDTYAVDNLSVAGTVPDIEKPLQSQLSLTAARLASGDRVLKNVSVHLATRGRALQADVRSMGFAELLLHAGAIVDADHQGFLLTALQLRYPEAQWNLQRPARIHFGQGDLSSEPLELRSGNQFVRAAGSLRGKRVGAELQIDTLDLALLPKPLVNPALRLAGLFSANVGVQGLLPLPEVKARAELRNGRFKQYDGLQLKLNASYDNDRAIGTADARGFGTGLRADFNVPIEALRMKRHDPVRLQATLDETSIEQVLRALGRSEPITGTAAAKIELSGTADKPQLKVAVQAKSLRHEKSPPADVSLVAQSGDQGKLASSLEWTIGGAKSSVVLRTPLTLSGLLQSPPSAQSLRSMPVEMDLDVHEMPLEVLRDAGLVQTEIHGKLSVRGEVRGSAKAPAGKIAIALAGGALGRAPPIDGSLVASASATGIQASANAQRNNGRLLDLTASVQVPLETVKTIDDLVARPLSVKATLGPASIEELRALSGTGPLRSERPRVPPPRGGGLGQPTQAKLDGVVHCDLSITGSLANPTVDLRSEFDQLSAEKVAIGKGKLEYTYRNASSALSLELASTAGAITVQGQSKLDLSYPALRRGLAYANAPFEATINSSKFDLSLLSGVGAPILVLGGTLDANAKVQGTIGVPHVQGKLEWKDGRIALAGYGEYQQIHLLIEGTEQQVQLRELLAHSGGGQAKISAEARRAGSNLTLSGRVNLDKFPIISDDQLVAMVSTDSTLEGDITPQLVNIRRLQIPQARIELPDTKRKDLQPITRPDDIVLLRNGVPINEKRYQKAVASLKGLGGAGDVEEAPQQSGARQLVLTVDAPRNIWVKGNDLNIEIGLSDGFRVEVAQAPLVFGEVKILQGRADLLGRRFDMQKNSTVRFTGPPASPTVDVTALYNDEREQVKVFVTVRGQTNNLSIKTSSEPPLTETEIYTLIATGHRTLRANSGASTSGSSVAVSAIGSLAANQLKSVLASKLPLDVLSIEAGEGGLRGTKLEAGTYVTDRIYIGYTARINARPELGQNANEVRVDYQISPRWSLEASYGDAKAGSADLIWSRDY